MFFKSVLQRILLKNEAILHLYAKYLNTLEFAISNRIFMMTVIWHKCEIMQILSAIWASSCDATHFGNCQKKKTFFLNFTRIKLSPFLSRGGLGLIDLRSGRIIRQLLETSNEGVFTVFATYTKVIKIPTFLDTALCSRNFQNVKLRLHGVKILQFSCHSDFTWNQILVNSNSQKCHF